MQSRPARSESSDSFNPKPKGLTIPAPTTATRPLLPFIALDLAIDGAYTFFTNFQLLSPEKHLTSGPKRSSELVDRQLSLFSGDLKSGKREQ